MGFVSLSCRATASPVKKPGRCTIWDAARIKVEACEKPTYWWFILIYDIIWYLCWELTTSFLEPKFGQFPSLHSRMDDSRGLSLTERACLATMVSELQTVSRYWYHVLYFLKPTKWVLVLAKSYNARLNQISSRIDDVTYSDIVLQIFGGCTVIL